MNFGGAFWGRNTSCADRGAEIAGARTSCVEGGHVCGHCPSWKGGSGVPRSERSRSSRGRRRERKKEPSMKGIPNLPGPEAGFLENAKRSSQSPGLSSWCRVSSLGYSASLDWYWGDSWGEP